MRHHTRRSAFGLAVLTSLAVGADITAAAAEIPSGSVSTAPRAEDVAGAQSGDLAHRVKAHLRRMEAERWINLMGKGPSPLFNAPGFGALVPEHERSLNAMLDAFAAEMQGMTPDPREQEFVAGVREDLVRLPEMSATQLQAFVPRHAGRVNRLIKLHRSMMSGRQR